MPDCYIESLPGLISTSAADKATNCPNAVSSDSLDSAGISTSIAASKAYADPNGDINVQIDGPYPVEAGGVDPVTIGRYQVFISKENAREKYTVYSNVSEGQSYDDNENEEAINDISQAIIYSELDDEDTTQEYIYLKIKHTDLMLARGTYVIRIFKETGENTNDYILIRMFTLTVKSDPIQGPTINNRYLSTAFRFDFRLSGTNPQMPVK